MSHDAKQKAIPPKPATAVTASCNHAWHDRLPFDDREDFESAQRGLIAAFDGDGIRREDGHTVWDFAAYPFLDEEQAPDSVHPSLWRLAQLNCASGLFKVCDRIYQIRGFDLSNMNVIEGDSGLIVMDPLVSTEVAAAALETYYRHRPRRPVVAVIYTHSHVDHFGGVRGVVTGEDVEAGKVSIYAPAGFVEEAISENVFAGPAMRRRAQYMYGAVLPRGPLGQVDAGLGKATSRGTVTLIPPTHTIAEAFETHVIDGVEIEFQLTPGTEAPSEMNLYFSGWRALCVAENACHCMHNVLTLRGALVRDPRVWSYYLGQTLARYGERSDVLFAQHHWPTWGGDRIREFLADQRDMYAFINDETLRLINHGLTPDAISEHLKSLPQPLANRWYARDYYGTVSHNVRAVYQRYMGFYDGNPAHLHPLPPVQTATRLVEWMGGAGAVLERARVSFDEGDYRWVAQIVNHVVFADPDNESARALQADALEQLGYQCESASWRNAYLTGAQELRNGVRPMGRAGSPDLLRALTPDLFFSLLAVRLNAESAAVHPMTLNWRIPDLGHEFALTVRNGVLTWLADESHADPDAMVSIDKTGMDQIVSGAISISDAWGRGVLSTEGDASQVKALFAMLDVYQPGFNIVTPPVSP